MLKFKVKIITIKGLQQQLNNIFKAYFIYYLAVLLVSILHYSLRCWMSHQRSL